MDTFRYLIILIGSLGVIVWFVWAAKYKRWGYVLAPAIWLISTTALFVYRVFFPFDPILVNNWSMFTYLYGTFVAFGIGLTLLLGWNKIKP